MTTEIESRREFEDDYRACFPDDGMKHIFNFMRDTLTGEYVQNSMKIAHCMWVKGRHEMQRAYEGVEADHNRLIRRLDELINGVDAAAPQASLVDLVSQVETISREMFVEIVEPVRQANEDEAKLFVKLAEDWVNQPKINSRFNSSRSSARIAVAEYIANKHHRSLWA